MNRNINISIIVAALITGLGSAFFAYMNLAPLVFIFFAAFTVTTGRLHGIKNVPNIVCSHACGWIWAMIMYAICNYVIGLTHIVPLGFFASIFLGSVLMLGIHLYFLMKTPLNDITILYTTIFCWFAVQDYSKIPYMIMVFLAGSVLSTVSDEIQDRLIK